MPEHDVLVIGAGLAGQRAALAAAERASRSGSSPRSTRCARTPTPPRAGSTPRCRRATRWESHAFDTVKGSDYLGDQDAIEIMCREAPEEILHLEHLGVTFHRNEEGKLGTRAFGGASQARTYYVADITGQAIMHVLYEQLMKYSDAVDRYEEYFTTALALDDDGNCVGAVLPQRPRRLDGAVRGQERDPRHRRQRPGLAADHQRPDLHRRRDRDGLPRRRAADGHGDDPVPPDDARRQGLPDHRGRPRRGRPPAERQGRALHGEVRAEQDGARLARRRLARRADRDQRGPRLPRRHRRARHHRRAAASGSTRRCARSCSSAATSPASTSPRSRSTSSPATTTRWAASRPTSTARTDDPRPLRRRRGAPASRSTAATASAPTRCSTR